MDLEQCLVFLENAGFGRVADDQLAAVCSVSPASNEFKSLQQVLEREIMALQYWQKSDEPAFALQQIRNQALVCNFPALAAEAERSLSAIGAPWIAEQPLDVEASSGLLRTLPGGPGGDLPPLCADGRSTLNRTPEKLEIRDIETGNLIASYPLGKGFILPGPENHLLIASRQKDSLQIHYLVSGKKFIEFSGDSPQIIKISGDGRFIGTGNGTFTGFDGEYFTSFEVNVWNVRERFSQWHKKGEHDSSGGMTALAISNDGRYAAAVGCCTLYLGSLTNGSDLGEWPSRAVSARDLEFSPTSETLLVNNLKAIDVVDMNSFELRTLVPPEDKYLNTMVISPDGKLVLGVGSEWFGLWEISTGKLLWGKEIATNYQNSAWFIADQGLIAITTKIGCIEILDQSDGKSLGQCSAHAKTVSSAAGTADEKYLVTTDGSEVKVWNLKTICAAGKAKDQSHESFYIHLTPQGRNAVLVKPPTVKVMTSADSEVFSDLWQIMNIPLFSGVSLSPDGAWVFCYSSDGTLRRFSIDGNAQASGFLQSSRRQKILPWSTDSAHVVFVSDDSLVISVWKAVPGSAILEGPPLEMQCKHKLHDLAFSPDGRLLFSAHEDAVRVLDLEKRGLVATFAGWADRVAAGNDGFVLVGHRHHAVEVWNLASGQREAEGRAAGYNGAALSPDGRWAVTETQTGVLTVEMRCAGQAGLVKTGEIEGSVKEFAFDPSALGVVFAPDGEHALTTLKEKGLAWWHLPSCRRVARVRGFLPFVRVAVSQDCRTVAATDSRTGIHFLRLHGSLLPPADQP